MKGYHVGIIRRGSGKELKQGTGVIGVLLNRPDSVELK